ncbi:MAG: DUF3853 family protein [Bacteroidales bacterium]|nr:DUF3853 family protein [Candidatus Cacconaster equifaecalis]
MATTNFIATMTVSEFIDSLNKAGLIICKEPQPEPKEKPLDFSDSSRFGCGLQAIQNRYGVSVLTAQRYKSGILSPAVFQVCRGGKFYIDYEKADKILKEKKPKMYDKERRSTVSD